MAGHFEIASDARGQEIRTVTEPTVRSRVIDDLVDVAKQCDGEWLPLELSCFVELQAVAGEAGGRGVASHTWEGILPGGAGVPLPPAFVAHVFSRSMIRECLQKAPRPVDCTRVGASADQPATAEVVTVGAPEVGYPQSDSNACVVCTAASALLYVGAQAAAQAIYGLKSQSLKLQAGANRVTFVRHQSRKLLQPEWQSCNLRWGQRMDGPAHSFASVSALLATAPGSVIVLQLLDSSGFPNHCVAVIDGWIFDTNKSHALPAAGDGALRAALDASCLGGATFVGVLGGFQLTPPIAAAASRGVKRAVEWPSTHEGDSKASCLEEALLSCSACCEGKPVGMFSASQLRKKAKRRCKGCTDVQ